MSSALAPIQIDPYSSTEILLAWTSGERYRVPYVELRLMCPCAACVDENTGRRTIQKSSIKPDIRPKAVNLIGRYAVKFEWSDRHTSGIYPFDRLHDICTLHGKRI